MATRRPMRPMSHERPLFRKPKRGGSFPWWIAAAGAGLIIVIVVVALLLAQGKAPTPKATVSPTVATSIAPIQLTGTPGPTPVPTVVTRACTVKEDTRLYREPRDDSISQSLAAGRTVNVIDEAEDDGRTWYRVMLPGYSDVLYMRVEMVECK